MNEDELKNFLFMLSVESIYRLSNGSKDPISTQESLERIGAKGRVVNCLKIVEVLGHSNSKKDVQFILSDSFHNINKDITSKYKLDKLMWIFKIPEYKNGSVVNWLSKSKIDLRVIDNSTLKINLKQLKSAIVNAESD